MIDEQQKFKFPQTSLQHNNIAINSPENKT